MYTQNELSETNNNIDKLKKFLYEYSKGVNESGIINGYYKKFKVEDVQNGSDSWAYTNKYYGDNDELLFDFNVNDNEIRILNYKFPYFENVHGNWFQNRKRIAKKYGFDSWVLDKNFPWRTYLFYPDQDLNEINKGINNFFSSKYYEDMLLEIKNRPSRDNVNNLSYKEQLKALEYNWKLVDFIPNLTEEMQLIVVSNRSTDSTLKHILRLSPSKEVILKACNSIFNVEYIPEKYMEDLDVNKAIARNLGQVKYLKILDEEVLLEIFKEDKDRWQEISYIPKEKQTKKLIDQYFKTQKSGIKFSSFPLCYIREDLIDYKQACWILETCPKEIKYFLNNKEVQKALKDNPNKFDLDQVKLKLTCFEGTKQTFDEKLNRLSYIYSLSEYFICEFKDKTGIDLEEIEPLHLTNPLKGNEYICHTLTGQYKCDRLKYENLDFYDGKEVCDILRNKIRKDINWEGTVSLSEIN